MNRAFQPQSDCPSNAHGSAPAFECALQISGFYGSSFFSSNIARTDVQFSFESSLICSYNFEPIINRSIFMFSSPFQPDLFLFERQKRLSSCPETKIARDFKIFAYGGPVVLLNCCPDFERVVKLFKLSCGYFST